MFYDESKAHNIRSYLESLKLLKGNGGVGEIRTLAGFNPPNDLANRPLQPLEYHSV